MKTVIEMAREAGLIGDGEPNGAMEAFIRKSIIAALPRFTALVREDEREASGAAWPQLLEAAVLSEREACAKVCDEMFSHAFAEDEYDAALKCAAAIRARKTKEQL